MGGERQRCRRLLIKDIRCIGADAAVLQRIDQGGFVDQLRTGRVDDHLTMFAHRQPLFGQKRAAVAGKRAM